MVVGSRQEESERERMKEEEIGREKKREEERERERGREREREREGEIGEITYLGRKRHGPHRLHRHHPF